MAHAVRMPKPGQMTEECTIVAWHKQEGDAVAAGDVLFEIETDKSNMDVEAFEDGVLLKVVVPVGETAPVNAICAWVGAEGETVPVVSDEPAPEGRAETRAPTAPTAPIAPPEPTAPAAGPAAASASAATAPRATAGRLLISPRANRLAAEAGLDPRLIAGTGPGGRIVEKDVKAAIAAGASAGLTTSAASTAFASTTTSAPTQPPAAPATETPAAQRPTTDVEAPPQPMSRMRRVIAERLTASWTSTPHFTITVATDVTGLLALREELRSVGTTLTVTDFVLAATAQTLAEFPAVNSRTDGVSVWPRSDVHLGLAVSIPDGLVVPVIRHADRLSVAALHDRAAVLARAARDGTLGPDDMTGGTFTVSNLGMFAVDEFSAIINPGEAAILAVSSAIPTPVAVGDGIAVRSIMKLTLSADHRLVDGELGARFLGAIRRRLEDGAAFRTDLLNG